MKEAKLLTIEYKDEFDKVVSNPIQSWAWGDFKESMGAVPERIGFFENGKLVGGLQIIFSKLSKTKYTALKKNGNSFVFREKFLTER